MNKCKSEGFYLVLILGDQVHLGNITDIIFLIKTKSKT